MTWKEIQIEQKLLEKLEELKYTYRPDIRDKAALEQNFREKFEALNRVRLSDAEFARLRDGIVSADVFQAAKSLREYGHFEREDGSPLHYTLVNLKDWCKNHFEVINQLRVNTDTGIHQALCGGRARPHDLRRRAPERPVRAAGTGLEGAWQGGVGVDEEVGAVFEKAGGGREISGVNVYE